MGGTPSTLGEEQLREAFNLMQSGQMQSAITLLDVELSKSPSRTYAMRLRLLKAEIFEKQGKKAEQLEMLSLALREERNMFATARRDPVLLAKLGDLAIELGDRVTALDAYKRATASKLLVSEKYPRPPVPTELVDLRAFAHLIAGHSCLLGSMNVEAQEEYEKARMLKPEWDCAKFFRAISLGRQELKEQALLEFELLLDSKDAATRDATEFVLRWEYNGFDILRRKGRLPSEQAP